MNNEIRIFLTEPDAIKFRQFQQYYDTFMLLLKSGVFDQKSASIALNFDHTGVLQTIQRGDFLYSRQFDTTNPIRSHKIS